MHIVSTEAAVERIISCISIDTISEPAASDPVIAARRDERAMSDGV
jgi:hypothetical protein